MCGPACVLVGLPHVDLHVHKSTPHLPTNNRSQQARLGMGAYTARPTQGMYSSILRGTGKILLDQLEDELEDAMGKGKGKGNGRGRRGQGRR